MTNLTYRAIKSAPLTSDEIDSNFNNLNTYKLEVTPLGDVGIGTDTPNHYADYRTLTIDNISGTALDFNIGGVLQGEVYADATGFFIYCLSPLNLYLQSECDVVIKTGIYESLRINDAGYVGIGTSTPTSKLHVVGIPVYANNSAALAGGLTAGGFYRTGANPDLVCVVH